jgi:hypothetical protein
MDFEAKDPRFSRGYVVPLRPDLNRGGIVAISWSLSRQLSAKLKGQLAPLLLPMVAGIVRQNPHERISV